jgi:hypothetical protein
VDKLCLFKPSLLYGEGEEEGIPTIDDFAPNALKELEDIVLHKKFQCPHKGQ